MPMSILPLEQLKADDFQARVGFVATATALHRLPKRSPEVQVIRDALTSGEISEPSIREFVEALLIDLRRGEPFRHDLAISALAVALESQETDFAAEFLQDLA